MQPASARADAASALTTATGDNRHVVSFETPCHIGACFRRLAPVAALAQSIGYDSVDGADAGGDEPSSSHSRGHARGGRGGSSLEAYIEAGEIVTSELSPGNETLTYTRVAVGADVTVAGRNNAASASVRYERQIGYGRLVDGDAISGLVRGYAAVVPQVLKS